MVLHGVFTNAMGASFTAPEARPFGSAARLDYALVPKEVEVCGWFVPEELSHCSSTHLGFRILVVLSCCMGFRILVQGGLGAGSN